MKLTATVMDQRQPQSSNPVEHFAVADAMVDGSPALIAAALRAMADVIDPPPHIHLLGATPSLPWGDVNTT